VSTTGAFIGDVILGRYFALGNTCPVHLFLVLKIKVAPFMAHSIALYTQSGAKIHLLIVIWESQRTKLRFCKNRKIIPEKIPDTCTV